LCAKSVRIYRYRWQMISANFHVQFRAGPRLIWWRTVRMVLPLHRNPKPSGVTPAVRRQI